MVSDLVSVGTTGMLVHILTIICLGTFASLDLLPLPLVKPGFRIFQILRGLCLCFGGHGSMMCDVSGRGVEIAAIRGVDQRQVG